MLRRFRVTIVSVKKQYVFNVVNVFAFFLLLSDMQITSFLRRVFMCVLSGITVFFHFIS